MTEVETWNYDTRPTGNTAHADRIGKLTLYFSYSTIIAFSDDGKLIIRRNDWSSTTGRHLNSINRDVKRRVDKATFIKELQATIKKYNLGSVVSDGQLIEGV